MLIWSLLSVKLKFLKICFQTLQQLLTRVIEDIGIIEMANIGWSINKNKLSGTVEELLIAHYIYLYSQSYSIYIVPLFIVIIKWELKEKWH